MSVRPDLNRRIPPASRGRSVFSQHAKVTHKRASRMLGYALTLDDSAGWGAAAAVWVLSLTTGERAALAMAALASLEPEEVEFIANLALGHPPDEAGA